MLRPVVQREGPKPALASGGAEALLFATTQAAEGGPAALLGVDGATLVSRLLGQLESLGVRRAWLVTRPEWRADLEAAAASSALDVRVVAAPAPADDLARAAELAGPGTGPLLVGNAHVLAHDAAVAGLLADRRPASVALVGPPAGGEATFPVRAAAHRIASAGSPLHRVEGATGSFLGLVKVDAGDRDRLAAAAGELSELIRSDEMEEPADAGPGAPALLLVGLVRGGVRVVPRELRELYLAAPDSEASARTGEAELAGRDEDRALLDSAVKASDSPFTTYLVSPYSRYIVRFAARSGLTPNAVSLVAFAVGLAAAASFALGNRAGLVAGALLLQASFTLDCVDGQLARYTRTSTSFGGWLDLVFDRTKEYVVYAGLAIGATRGFDDDVWLLAAAALALLTVRHLADVSWVAGRESAAPPHAVPLDRPGDGAPGRRGGTMARWPGWVGRVNEIVRLPIGERFALVSLTAAVASPRTTFVALLVWGGVGGAYAQAVRIVQSTAAGSRVLRALAR